MELFEKIYLGALAFLVSMVAVSFIFVMFHDQTRIEGDLNHDNQLTIVDLSILAERIRNQ